MPIPPKPSPVYKDLDRYAFPAAVSPDRPQSRRRSSDEDGTLADEDPYGEKIDYNKLHVQTSYNNEHRNHSHSKRGISPTSPYEQAEQAQRLDDELELLRAENTVHRQITARDSLSRSRSINHTRSRTNAEPEDDFDIGTTPVYEQTRMYQPPAKPTTEFAKFFKKIHDSSFIVRYFCYIIPVSLILAVPLLLGAFRFKDATVGGVELMWFAVWLEIVWLTLWCGRIMAKCIPYPMGLVASLFTNADKMWRDLGKQLQIPLAMFFWMLAVEISFLPTMTRHHLDGSTGTKDWQRTMNKVIISIFVGVTLNFVEKVIIQLIAISFHLRTYADRIEINKFQTQSLVKLYIYSREKISLKDSDFEEDTDEPSSGARTPMRYIARAGKGARQALYKVGDVAGKVAGDFTGREIARSTHPQQVILQLLSSTSGSQVLARRLYRTFKPDDEDTVSADDLRNAFDNNEEADAAFAMFDKDMNGDISMEELEAVCVEIGRERKAITASLKDLDSVVSKLDNLFLFIVGVITILVFISLISTSAAGVLTSAGSAVLALSWLFSATAQEVLQSIVFVFIKHPFDVGDRVTIYGNTGTMGLGDDYFVKEISLLFTEFKKMEGHVVQAPNSYLNTLFILNQRRSGGLAEAVPVVMKFGTTLEQLEGLRNKLMDFVGSECREYQHNILTELKQVFECYSISMNVVFFYKSNWQNELLRLQRRNKFICALMVAMQDLGIEGPRRTWAGQSQEAPMYMANSYTPPIIDPNAPVHSPGPISPPAGPGPRTGTLARGSTDTQHAHETAPFPRPSILRHTPSAAHLAPRPRDESIAQMSKRVDFSLGMSRISSSADPGDVYDKPKPKVPQIHKPEDQATAGDGESLARTSSRDSGNTLRGRSRFFSRKGKGLFGSTTSTMRDLPDIEAGTGMPGVGGSVVMMQDMPHITTPHKDSDRNSGHAPSHMAAIPEIPGPSRRGTAMTMNSEMEISRGRSEDRSYEEGFRDGERERERNKSVKSMKSAKSVKVVPEPTLVVSTAAESASPSPGPEQETVRAPHPTPVAGPSVSVPRTTVEEASDGEGEGSGKSSKFQKARVD